MDFTGEGAILLTNDGEVAQKLQKSNEIIRKYHVKVDRQPTQEELSRLARGGRIEGRSMHPYHVRVAENYTRNALIEISFEGMGSLDIRQFFENKGFYPEKIARVGIGHLSAERMQPGAIKKLNPSSVAALFTQPELTKRIIDRSLETKGVKRHVSEEIKKPADLEDGELASFATGKARAPVGRGVLGAGAPAPKKAGAARPPMAKVGLASRSPRGETRSPLKEDKRADRKDWSDRKPSRSARPARVKDRPAPRPAAPARGVSSAAAGFPSETRGTRSEGRAGFHENRRSEGFSPRSEGSPAPRPGARTARSERGRPPFAKSAAGARRDDSQRPSFDRATKTSGARFKR